MKRGLLTALIPFVVLIAGFAQDCASPDAAGVHGTVVDPTGAVIPSAKITITDSSGKAQNATSDANGLFCAKLAPGSYKIQVAMQGFKTVTQEAHVIDGIQNLNFQLQVGTCCSGPQIEVPGIPVSFEPPIPAQIDRIPLSPEQLKAYKIKPIHGIYGIVADFSGTPIPQGRVVAMDERGKSHATCSNSSGAFRMKLKNGTYKVTATAPGFAAVTQEVELAGEGHPVIFDLATPSGSHVEASATAPSGKSPCSK